MSHRPGLGDVCDVCGLANTQCASVSSSGSPSGAHFRLCPMCHSLFWAGKLHLADLCPMRSHARFARRDCQEPECVVRQVVTS